MPRRLVNGSGVAGLAALDDPDGAGRAIIRLIEPTGDGIGIDLPVGDRVAVARKIRGEDWRQPRRREERSARDWLGCYGKRRAYTGWRSQNREKRE